MSNQLEKEDAYRLKLLELRSNHQRQGFRILYIESAEDGKLCGDRNRSLIPEALRVLASESQHQIKLAQNLLTQVQDL